MTKVRICEVCKQPIEPERAEGFPDTRICSEHARQIQAYQPVEKRGLAPN